MAALAGGITTISNFIPMASDEDPNAFADRVIKSLEARAIADVYPRPLVRPMSTPVGAPPDPLTQKKTYDALVARGIVGTGEDRMSGEQYDKNSLAWMKKNSAPPARPGWSAPFTPRTIQFLPRRWSALQTEDGGAGGTIHNFSQFAPEIGEVLAVQRSVARSRGTGAPILIDHVSSGRALKVAEDAQRRGLPVYVEVRPQYLHVTAQKYAGRGRQYVAGWSADAR